MVLRVGAGLKVGHTKMTNLERIKIYFKNVSNVDLALTINKLNGEKCVTCPARTYTCKNYDHSKYAFRVCQWLDMECTDE